MSLATESAREIKTINRKPTLEDDCGSYRLINDAGIYLGTFYVGFNWAKQKFVAEADPVDGLPW